MTAGGWGQERNRDDPIPLPSLYSSPSFGKWNLIIRESGQKGKIITSPIIEQIRMEIRVRHGLQHLRVQGEQNRKRHDALKANGCKGSGPPAAFPSDTSLHHVMNCVSRDGSIDVILTTSPTFPLFSISHLSSSVIHAYSQD